MITPRHILVAEMPYKLLSFLIEKKILNSFIDEVLKQHNFYSNAYCFGWTKHMYRPHKIDIIFCYSLFWKDTAQGMMFWDKINREWEELCTKEYCYGKR